MSFNCTKHGWSHLFNPCSACEHFLLTTGSSAGALKWPCEECAIKEVDIDELKDTIVILKTALQQIYDIGDFGGHARETAFKALNETGLEAAKEEKK
jgi:hypothetical protein